MRRWIGLIGGGVCTVVIGCGEAANNGPEMLQTPRQASSEAALPDLQPVPTPESSGQVTASSTESAARAVFDRWVAAATENDPDAWTKAEQELQALGATAVPSLIDVLETGQPLAREMAVMFLAQLGPQAEPAAEALTKLLNDESPMVRVNAAGVLTTFETAPESATQTLTALLSDTDPNIRTTAAGCLGNVAELPPAVIQRLAGCLRDETPSVRAAAATTLGRCGEKAASTLLKLRQLATDEDDAVRQAAAVAVRQIDPASRPASDTVPVGATNE